SVGVFLDGIREDIDPEHPDSIQEYRVLTVTRFEFGIRTRHGERFLSAPTVHVFHAVRGDVARLAVDQPADSTRWYIRRWIEDVSAVRAALGQRQGGCGEEPSPVPGPRSAGRSPAAPSVLAVRPLANPACSKLEVTCDLPGSEPARVEVYD